MSDESKLTCTEFQNLFADRLALGEDPEEQLDHPHARDCERCNGLIRDLRKIADAARLLLPKNELGDDWSELT